MGQMPVLDVDGQKLHQSLSICRWLAKRVGLDGKTDFENYEIDSVTDTIDDLRNSKCIFFSRRFCLNMFLQIDFSRNRDGLLRTRCSMQGTKDESFERRNNSVLPHEAGRDCESQQWAFCFETLNLG